MVILNNASVTDFVLNKAHYNYISLLFENILLNHAYSCYAVS